MPTSLGLPGSYQLLSHTIRVPLVCVCVCVCVREGGGGGGGGGGNNSYKQNISFTTSCQGISF